MIYVTGDMHGDIDRIYDPNFKRLKEGDTLIIAGDFGYLWDGGKKERKILKYLGTRKYTVCFLDGAHDDMKKLGKYRKTVYKGGVVHRIYKRLYHMCRGQIFTIDGLRIFTFGGGEIIDFETPDSDEKLPNGDEMREGDENLAEYLDTVDYIITHEPPAKIKNALRLRVQKPSNINALNAYFDDLNSRCKFRQWFFGSMHIDKEITPRHTCVFTSFLALSGSEQYSNPINIDDNDDDFDYEEVDYNEN